MTITANENGSPAWAEQLHEQAYGSDESPDEPATPEPEPDTPPVVPPDEPAPES